MRVQPGSVSRIRDWRIGTARTMNSIGGPELTFLVVALLLVGVAPLVTWRRGGSKSRIVVAFLVSLIPYGGFIIGMVIALTTKRTKGSVVDAIAGAHVEISAGAITRGSGRAGGLLKTVVVVLLVLVPIVGGVVGYYLGRQSDQTALPTWTDREIRATGTQNIGTLRCTYHLADGTVRVRESVIALSINDPNNRFATPNPFGARTPDCPSSP